MKRAGLCILLVTILTSLESCGRSVIVPTEPTDAEYKVLSAYLAHNLTSDPTQKNSSVLIIKQTLPVDGDPRWIAAVYKSEPTLKTTYDEVFRALLESNRYPGSFQSSFTLNVPYKIVDSPTDSDSWPHLPRLPVLHCDSVQLSRVGLGRDGNRAAFIESSRIGPVRDRDQDSCFGSWEGSDLVIMEKGPDSAWKIVKRVQLSVS